MKNKILPFLIAVVTISGVEIQLSAADTQFPPAGSNIAEQIDVQNRIKEQIKRLDSEEWNERKAAHKKLLDMISSNKHLYRFFLKETGNSTNPEIKLSSKEILRAYFEKNVYDPSKGNGFIGIQLAPAGSLNIKKQRYFPIRVVMPIAGFPGAKAGLKAGDLILETDQIKCSSKFRISEFIAYIATKSPGETVTLKLLSGGRVVTKKVILGKRPESEMRSLPKKTIKELFDEWYKLQKKEFKN
jgi:hypothetical protein